MVFLLMIKFTFIFSIAFRIQQRWIFPDLKHAPMNITLSIVQVMVSLCYTSMLINQVCSFSVVFDSSVAFCCYHGCQSGTQLGKIDVRN
jgi:hypothetical protein